MSDAPRYPPHCERCVFLCRYDIPPGTDAWFCRREDGVPRFVLVGGDDCDILPLFVVGDYLSFSESQHMEGHVRAMRAIVRLAVERGLVSKAGVDCLLDGEDVTLTLT